jgi:hypothetical protein
MSLREAQATKKSSSEKSAIQGQDCFASLAIAGPGMEKPFPQSFRLNPQANSLDHPEDRPSADPFAPTVVRGDGLPKRINR